VDVVFDIATPPSARPGLGHGFSVFLRIVEWEAEDVVQVPLGALFRQNGGWAVFAVEDGVAEERAVTLGRRGARSAHVVDGLAPGETIVTHPGEAVADGVAVIDRRAL
jgi:HlyD family secretion protein